MLIKLFSMWRSHLSCKKNCFLHRLSLDDQGLRYVSMLVFHLCIIIIIFTCWMCDVSLREHLGGGTVEATCTNVFRFAQRYPCSFPRGVLRFRFNVWPSTSQRHPNILWEIPRITKKRKTSSVEGSSPLPEGQNVGPSLKNSPPWLKYVSVAVLLNTTQDHTGPHRTTQDTTQDPRGPQRTSSGS